MKLGLYTVASALMATGLSLMAYGVSAQASGSNAPKAQLSGETKTVTVVEPIKPFAGSLGTGKPSAGSLTIGKPTAGSFSSGKPSAGSLAVNVTAGSMAVPAGTTERISGTQLRRLKSTDDGTSYTRKPRERHRRRY